MNTEWLSSADLTKVNLYGQSDIGLQMSGLIWVFILIGTLSKKSHKRTTFVATCVSFVMHIS